MITAVCLPVSPSLGKERREGGGEEIGREREGGGEEIREGEIRIEKKDEFGRNKEEKETAEDVWQAGRRRSVHVHCDWI